MRFFTPAKPASRHGRPGTIRAIAGGVAVVLLGVATLTSLRTPPDEDRPERAQAQTQAPAKPDLALLAMARLAAPPAPGSFSIGDLPEPAAPVLASSGEDCVKTLAQVLSDTIVRFEEDSAALTAAHIDLMTEVGDLIMGCDAAYVVVGGHADGSGDDAINLALSWERADRTLNHLLLLGVDPFAVEAVGYGARAPLSQGSDEEDGSDRRVDFKVMRKP